jgi:hypothetical protein
MCGGHDFRSVLCGWSAVTLLRVSRHLVALTVAKGVATPQGSGVTIGGVVRYARLVATPGDHMAPSKGTPRQAFRLDPDLVEEFKDAVGRTDPPQDMSAVVRGFLAWYVRRRGAKLPARPERPR